MKIGILKAYKNNVATIVLSNELTEDYTIKEFHEDRCNKIDELCRDTDFDRFETELRTV